MDEADVGWFDANLAAEFFNTNPDGTFIDRKAFLAQISARRDSLLAILNETPQLEERTRRNAAAYLGEFFEEAGSPSKVADFMKVCLH